MRTAIELPDRRLVCEHGLVQCGHCWVDYSFMDEFLDSQDEEDSSDDQRLSDEETKQHERQVPVQDFLEAQMQRLGIRIVRDTGLRRFRIVGNKKPGEVFAQIFEDDDDEDDNDDENADVIIIFRLDVTPHVVRFAWSGDIDQLIIFADGACLDNGRDTARAGFGFRFAPRYRNEEGGVSARLELRGPDGRIYPQTSNRAELRAAIAALQYRSWSREGFKGIIIVMDSEYVIQGATLWVKNWLLNKWRTSSGKPAKNRDLWETLLQVIAECHNTGLGVKLWKICRADNSWADELAKKGAEAEVQQSFCPIYGIEAC